MIAAETMAGLTLSADAFFVITAACALYFRWCASTDPKKVDRGRAAWGGEVTPMSMGNSELRPAAERAMRASLWLKFFWVSLALVSLANLAA